MDIIIIIIIKKGFLLKEEKFQGKLGTKTANEGVISGKVSKVILKCFLWQNYV
jgi:hypothetical protein